ncbi:Ribosomal protein S18 acetylase RimI [Sanguibacter gelidistatuariae]|uniref:Ribosomal protein S18 acetylase RimI n=1 Tax=Sanguibacter gelidistatuariae TaxID=1814289 RepID=A0A1G6HGG7_9MICO|nr:GNAT family N-acetyltransferase [Sanguibacter gelidistatuariae]SDB93264.1 Ribosomal protein S18 acetylase RimI [Sanguibacter gelidistatuariae]
MPHDDHLPSGPRALAFRPATPADLPDLVALVNVAYRSDESRDGWTTEAHLVGGPRADAAMLAKDIERAGSQILLAERAEALVGCAHVTQVSTTAAYFGLFAVRPSDQGTGVGRRLLAEAERVAREEWQLATLEMTVLDVRSELLAYYGRRGFQPTGDLKPFPPPGADGIVVLHDGLQLVVLRKDLD